MGHNTEDTPITLYQMSAKYALYQPLRETNVISKTEIFYVFNHNSSYWRASYCKKHKKYKVCCFDLNTQI